MSICLNSHMKLKDAVKMVILRTKQYTQKNGRLLFGMPGSRDYLTLFSSLCNNLGYRYACIQLFLEVW